jgi:predicted nucleotidyltransferase
MHQVIADQREALAALCRAHGVAQLQVFGSAARAQDFDPAHSDVDFLVSFTPDTRDRLGAFLDFRDALEALLSRPVDLVERDAIAASRNYIRRRQIMAEAEPVYG